MLNYPSFIFHLLSNATLPLTIPIPPTSQATQERAVSKYVQILILGNLPICQIETTRVNHSENRERRSPWTAARRKHQCITHAGTAFVDFIWVFQLIRKAGRAVLPMRMAICPKSMEVPNSRDPFPIKRLRKAAAAFRLRCASF